MGALDTLGHLGPGSPFGPGVDARSSKRMSWLFVRIHVLPSSTVIPKVVESIIYLWQLFEDGATAVLDAQEAIVDLINETGIARRPTTVFDG